MDLTSLLFLVLMVAVTGLMAFAGDSLGRYLGKKRVRLWTLRPKHTAGLLTAAAGSLGAAFVVLALMGISEPVRVWILSGNQVRHELESATKELEALKTEKGSLSSELKTMSRRANAEAARAAQSESRNRQLAAKNSSLEAASDKLQKEIKNKIADAARLSSEVAKQKSLLGDLRFSLASVRKEFETEKRNGTAIKSDNAAMQAENLRLTQANAKLEQQRTDLEASSKNLQIKVSELMESITTLQKTFDDTSAEQKEMLRASQAQLGQSQTELQNTLDALGQMRQELQRLETERSTLLSISEASRQNPMVMEKQDELSRLAIPANSTLAEARSLLAVAIGRAEKTAIGRGSGVSAVSRSAALFVDIPRTGKQPISGEQQKEAIAQELAGKPEERVLLLRALVNTFAGEPVPLDAVIFRNPVVYQSGQVVAETRLDGRLEQEDIARKLEEFVGGPMAQGVIRAGVIPAKGMPHPLGELSRDSVLSIVQAVKESGVSVKVQFLAATETRAGDSLKISYRLR